MMPVSELQSHGITETCRTRPNVMQVRGISAGVFGVTGFMLGFALWLAILIANTPGPVTPLMVKAAVFSVFTVLPLTAGFGFYMGKYQINPFWVVRRRWYSPPVDDWTDDDGVVHPGVSNPEHDVPVILPIEHTFARGIPPEEWRLLNEQLMMEYHKAMKEESDDDDQRESYGLLGGGGSFDPYKPIVPRATTLYERLQGRNIRENLRGDQSKTERIKIGATIALAGITGVLFLFLMITTVQ